jgi:hypothetical protein
MALVRSTEKSSNEDGAELCELLLELASLYSRRGLLLGNAGRAQQVLESSSASTTSKSRGGAHPRRTDAQSNTDAADNESLVLSALNRILSTQNDLSSAVLALAVNVLAATFSYAQSDCQIALAEREILLKFSRSLLTGLESTIKRLNSIPSRNENDTMALISTLQATTSLVSLLRQQSPRSIISKLSQVAWTALVDSNERVRKSSASLLSVLTLTGVENTTPADAWSTAVFDAALALIVIQTAMAPLGKHKPTLQISLERTRHAVTKWVSDITSFDSEAKRVQQCQRCIQGLSAYLVALLTRESYPDSTRLVMVTSKLPIEFIVGLCESMILFPSAAETHFFSTKKRLRLEVVQDGLLSSTAIVLEMANLVKFLGHDIMDATITAAGVSLLPFARRVMRLSHDSLLASSSTALQNVLDPTKSAWQAHGNRKEWLHISVPIRLKTIQTYGTVIKTTGASVVASSLSNQHAIGATLGNDVSLAISAIAGSLLEQLSWPEVADEAWANHSERVKLCIVALDALLSLLTIIGGYLCHAGRSLIDSITVKCLTLIDVKSECSITTYPSVKVKILKLASACICTPWPDGAMSSLMSDLLVIAKICVRDRDPNVSGEAACCLRICDSLSMPRIPALSVVMSQEHTREAKTAMSLEENLKEAKNEMAATELVGAKPSRPLDESPEKSKTKKKRQKVEPSTDADINMVVSRTKRHSDDPSGPPETSPQLTKELKILQATTIDETNVNAHAGGSPTREPGIDNTLCVAKESIPQKKPITTAPVESLSEKADGGDDSDFDFPDIVVDGGPDEEDQA